MVLWLLKNTYSHHLSFQAVSMKCLVPEWRGCLPAQILIYTFVRMSCSLIYRCQIATFRCAASWKWQNMNQTDSGAFCALCSLIKCACQNEFLSSLHLYTCSDMKTHTSTIMSGDLTKFTDFNFTMYHINCVLWRRIHLAVRILIWCETRDCHSDEDIHHGLLDYDTIYDVAGYQWFSFWGPC
jgi:hypothetical protein